MQDAYGVELSLGALDTAILHALRMKDREPVVWAFPLGKLVTGLWLDAWIQNTARHMHPADGFIIGRSSALAVLRTTIAHGFLDDFPDHKWLVMIDDDNAYLGDHDPVRIMQAAARENDALIVGAPYAKRSAPYEHLVYERRPDGNGGTNLQNVHHEQGGVHDVDAMGLGFVMIHRDAFTAMKEPWFGQRSGYPDEEDEDDSISFCVRARAAGLRILADYRVEIGHIDETPRLLKHWKAAKLMERSGAEMRAAYEGVLAKEKVAI